MFIQKFKRSLLAAGLALGGLLGAVSAAHAAVVVTFDPAYGAAIPNLGFKGTATLDVTPGCRDSEVTGLVDLQDPYIQAQGCSVVVLSAHIDFYNTTLGSNSVFSSIDLTGPYLGEPLRVLNAYFDQVNSNLIGISTNDSSIFAVSLQDLQPNPANSVDYSGSMVLYFETGEFLNSLGQKSSFASQDATTLPGLGGARLATCTPASITSGICTHTSDSNLAQSTFTNDVQLPEPGSLALVAGALAGLGWARRRQAAR